MGVWTVYAAFFSLSAVSGSSPNMTEILLLTQSINHLLNEFSVARVKRFWSVKNI